MKKKRPVKKSGFSYLELIYALFLFINFFVLTHQLIVNLNIENKIKDEKHIIYETISTRIEVQIKEASDIVITQKQIAFKLKGSYYRYYLSNQALIMNIDYSITYLVRDILEVNFRLDYPYLLITFTDIDNMTYESRVIYDGT